MKPSKGDISPLIRSSKKEALDHPVLDFSQDKAATPVRSQVRDGRNNVSGGLRNIGFHLVVFRPNPRSLFSLALLPALSRESECERRSEDAPTKTLSPEV
jgi:hypothetical protein